MPFLSKSRNIFDFQGSFRKILFTFSISHRHYGSINLHLAAFPVTFRECSIEYLFSFVSSYHHMVISALTPDPFMSGHIICSIFLWRFYHFSYPLSRTREPSPRPAKGSGSQARRGEGNQQASAGQGGLHIRHAEKRGGRHRRRGRTGC